jgi:hypothetical protein
MKIRIIASHQKMTKYRERFPVLGSIPQLRDQPVVCGSLPRTGDTGLALLVWDKLHSAKLPKATGKLGLCSPADRGNEEEDSRRDKRNAIVMRLNPLHGQHLTTNEH